MKISDLIMENSETHSDAVDELKSALIKRQKEIRAADSDQVYDIIDGIMTKIAKSHGITGKKLHDVWVKRYKQVPDTWIMKPRT